MPENHPQITSFVIRFVHPESETGEYRGSISHVETDEQIIFVNWEDAVDFMNRYIPIERVHHHPTPPKKQNTSEQE